MENKFNIENLELYYGNFKALKNINMGIKEKEITAFIGPSGCGKSTLLKSLNRMNDCNSPLRMSKMKNCKKLDNQAKTRLNQGFLRI